MRLFRIFTVIFFLAGIFSVNAQDLIFLRNGKMIEAKVMEISQAEIRYKSFNNLQGSVIVIPAYRVLSIRYENGAVDVINAIIYEEETEVTTALDPDKTTFGMNVNPGSILSIVGGPSSRFDFTKGNLNTEISLMFPSLGIMRFLDEGYINGFGILATFNYFSHKQNGGFYLGGGIGFIYYSYTQEEEYRYYNEAGYYDYRYRDEEWVEFISTIGLNVGYKFVTESGIYFRTGGYIGIFISNYDAIPWIIPDLSIGYCFK